MSPLVPAADREQLSRVRASLAQDGLDLAMIGHDRDQLLLYAAEIATGLAKQGGWQVEKYDASRLETLLADLVLARFDGALQSLAGHVATEASPSPRACLVFIPDAQNLSTNELGQLLRLMRGTGHSALRVVTLFTGSPGSCEAKLTAVGPRVARWYLDEAPGEAADETPRKRLIKDMRKDMRKDMPRGVSQHVNKHATKRAIQRTVPQRRVRSAGIGLVASGSLMLALVAGPALWPSADELAQLLVRPPSVIAPAGSLAGTPVFMPAKESGNDAIKLPPADSAEPSGVSDQ